MTVLDSPSPTARRRRAETLPPPDPRRRRPARTDADAADRRHAPGHDLRRVLALSGAEGRPDGQRLDPGGGDLASPCSAWPAAWAFGTVSVLEHNIVQTAGSAGESIAFGIGVTMPAIMILGFDLEITRVMTVAILGGLLGILMMIPLRRALIVQQHGVLKYPEGTACAEVLKAGATAEERALGRAEADGAGRPRGGAIGRGGHLRRLRRGRGLQAGAWRPSSCGRTCRKRCSARRWRPASVSAEISPELLGVGYIIGPKIASTMAAGGVLAYLFLIPAIRFFGAAGGRHRARRRRRSPQMAPDDIRGAYVLYIGAGRGRGGRHHQPAALPADDLARRRRRRQRLARPARRDHGARAAPPRTDRDLSPRIVGDRPGRCWSAGILLSPLPAHEHPGRGC